MALRKITGHGHRTGATHSSIMINIPPRFGIVASSVIGVTSSVTDMTWRMDMLAKVKCMWFEAQRYDTSSTAHTFGIYR